MKIQKSHIVLGVVTLGLVGVGVVGTYLELTRPKETIAPYRPTAAQLEDANKKLGEYKQNIKEPQEGATNDQIFHYHFGLANSLAAATRYSEAISEYKKAEAVEGVDKNYVFYQALGLTYFNAGDRAAAKSAYQTALQNAQQDSTLSQEDKQLVVSDIQNALGGL